MFWLSNPTILLSKPLELWPICPKFNRAQSYNALSRLVILLSVVSALYLKQARPLIIGLGALAIIALFYRFKSGKFNQEILTHNPNEYQKGETLQREYTPGVTTYGNDGTPYGNPNAYDRVYATNQKPLGELTTPIWGDQFIDKLYNQPGVIPPGINFHRVPDTTGMARQIYPLTSWEAGQGAVGETDHAGFPLLRH